MRLQFEVRLPCNSGLARGSSSPCAIIGQHSGGLLPTLELRHTHHLFQSIETSLDADSFAFFRVMRQRADALRLPLYLVGGPVRDALLGRPVEDLDFVLEGDAVGLAEAMAAEMGWQLVVHRRFGTAALTHGDSHVDLVTARRESYPTPGSLPRVVPGSIGDDLARRDFTINTLALPLGSASTLQPTQHERSVPTDSVVLDCHGGLADLRQGLIRTLHAKSFVDDPTRIFRAVRYEQRFGFRLEPATGEQVRSALEQRCVDAVSGDRLRHELERIFSEERPAPALKRAEELGVLAAVHPALDKASVAVLPETAPSPVYWALLVYQLTVGQAGELVRRLNASARWKKAAQDTIEVRDLESRLADPRLPTSQVFDLLAGRDEAALQAVARGCGNPAVRRRLTEFCRELRSVNPVLDGNAVVAMGVPPGPAVGDLLRRLRAARLDRLVQSEEEERGLVADFMVGRMAG